MALKLDLINPTLHRRMIAQRIVPIRFARAVVNVFADPDAPDADDRGFLTGTFATAHGSTLGIIGPAAGAAAGPVVRILVVRDRIDVGAKLFPTIDDPSVAQIEFPVAVALNPTGSPASGTSPERQGDCVFVRGVATTERDTLLRIRFGSTTGPVLAEIAIRVFPVLTINVQAHLVTINGEAPTTTQAQITEMFNRIGAIYRPAGVSFVLAPTVMNESVTGFARAGTVTLTNVPEQQNIELQTVLRQNSVPGFLNAYFFRHFFDTTSPAAPVDRRLDNVLGAAMNADDARANPPDPRRRFPGCQAGAVMRDSNDQLTASLTAAHEIGHALRLNHYAQAELPNARHDIWSQRNLMHNTATLSDEPAPRRTPARTQVGYGLNLNNRPMRGGMLGIKQRGGIPQSDQVNILRRAVLNATFAPV